MHRISQRILFYYHSLLKPNEFAQFNRTLRNYEYDRATVERSIFAKNLKYHAALQLDCKRERRTHAAANSASSSALRPASTCLVESSGRTPVRVLPDDRHRLGNNGLHLEQLQVLVVNSPIAFPASAALNL